MPFRGHWALSVSFTSTEGIVHAHTHTPNWQKIVELQLLLRPGKFSLDRPRCRRRGIHFRAHQIQSRSHSRAVCMLGV
uniref:Putative secreted protein n=1 Tax=Anopheles marajoara TaxID=58244 RepID=A0A2M4CC98_9DIPT